MMVCIHQSSCFAKIPKKYMRAMIADYFRPRIYEQGPVSLYALLLLF
jgi:hypothetical protein